MELVNLKTMLDFEHASHKVSNDWMYCDKTRSSGILKACVCYAGFGCFDAIKFEPNLEVAVAPSAGVWLDSSARGKPL